ncbi:heavy-metal-associated domain-containing protein [uncultured Olleya sp.]|uniref:heavy-metal-associated domain-containing protein n=1 Tax=uncultured Olleya sp. TaxID=757243 RepID=UPI000487BF7F|nr:heavy-metal-associated domain-containing protein [uncultured Olleya sp.]
MKKIIVLLLMVTSVMTFAQDKNKRESLDVDGVCGMCKARIEKACFKTKGVKSAIWSVETHELKLIYDERKTDLKTIQQSVLNAGHDSEGLKAPDEAYASVHDCCKYRDEAIKDDHKKE